MADLVRVAITTKYSYDGLVDFLAKMHLSTALQHIAAWPYADFINTEKLRHEKFAELLKDDLYIYISQFYEDQTLLDNYGEFLDVVIPMYYRDNVMIYKIFEDTINRMIADGISEDKVKQAAEYLRIQI